jgi:hypothetical protein
MSASARALDEADRPARAGAERDVLRDVREAVRRRLARRRRDVDGVADELRVDVDLEHGALQCREVLERERLLELGMVDELPLDHGELLVVLRVADEHLEEEAVDLRLGERIRALGLDRVLRRHHEERLGDAMRLVADRDLPFLHDLEKRGLHLRGRAVDLVREQEVAEDRAELGVERPLLRAVDPCADEVGGHQVGRELDARERSAEHAGRGLDRQRLRKAGHPLDEEVTLRQEAHEHPLEHRVLAGDDPPDLEEGLLELFLRLLGGGQRPVGVLGHPWSSLSAFSALRSSYESTLVPSLGKRHVKH